MQTWRPSSRRRESGSAARLAEVGRTEELINRIYAAFDAGDVEGVIADWHEEGELKPLSADRSYQGHDALRLYLTNEIRQFAAANFRIYTVLEQKHLALVFGRYSAHEDGGFVDRGIFWIVEQRDGKLFAWQGFENVGEAFAEFKLRLAGSAKAPERPPE
jgi:ketosteroid isomerase-like protein